MRAYRYPHTSDELRNRHSTAFMERAREALSALDRVNREGPFKGDPASLGNHRCPTWFVDAKLGIFYDWGPYAVAGYARKHWDRARYPDWYLHHMYGRYRDYHRETWGRDWERDDFIGLFTGTCFDADEIVDLVKRSGARYLIPFNKHHDGYCLWNSSFTFRNSVEMPPHRDFSAELVTACRAAGIPHGFYFSVEDYEHPLLDDAGGIELRYWDRPMAPPEDTCEETGRGVIGPFRPERDNARLGGKVPVRNFIEDYLLPQAKEFIDLHDPDILWFDGEWLKPAEYYQTGRLVAYFYNRARDRKEVVANDRFGRDSRGRQGDYYTSETDEIVEPVGFPWEECRPLSSSYGYNRLDTIAHYLSAAELVHMFVRIVAKGGNLLLLVTPDGRGSIPIIQRQLLDELGGWLQCNGEAIYGTRPYTTLKETTQAGDPVWYTLSADRRYGYAILLDYPRDETVLLPGARVVPGSRMQMLGYEVPLPWVDTGEALWGVTVRLPEEMLPDPGRRPCRHAWVLRFEHDDEARGDRASSSFDAGAVPHKAG